MLVLLLSACFMASAGEDITVTGFVEDSVLLPCNCSGINLKQEFKWQVEENKEKGTKTKLFFKFDRTSNVTNNRFETFLREDSSNCSILLKNITLDDQGKYGCRFHSGEQYSRVFVNLNVCGTNISQYSESTPRGGKVYHCDVKHDCKRDTVIQWTLDGNCLTNSSITTTSRIYNDTGHHHFHSTLKTEDKFSSEPKCEVRATCSIDQVLPVSQPGQHLDPRLRTLFKVVPVVLLLGFLLIWCRRGTSHRFPSERGMENGDFSHVNTNSDNLQSENVKVLSFKPEEVINH